jgi:hypothetical protein
MRDRSDSTPSQLEDKSAGRDVLLPLPAAYKSVERLLPLQRIMTHDSAFRVELGLSLLAFCAVLANNINTTGTFKSGLHRSFFNIDGTDQPTKQGDMLPVRLVTQEWNRHICKIAMDEVRPL